MRLIYFFTFCNKSEFTAWWRSWRRNIMLIRSQFDKLEDDENFGKITPSDVVETHDWHIFREEWLSTIYLYASSVAKRAISEKDFGDAIWFSFKWKWSILEKKISNKNHPYKLLFHQQSSWKIQTLISEVNKCLKLECSCIWHISFWSGEYLYMELRTFQQSLLTSCCYLCFSYSLRNHTQEDPSLIMIGEPSVWSA